jgi:hypothetical protein
LDWLAWNAHSSQFLKQDRQLEKLRAADGAAFNEYELQHDMQCLSGTRVDLLNQVKVWSEKDHNEHIFWLNGMAGTGKSTIARTVASSFDKEGQLGGSFFSPVARVSGVVLPDYLPPLLCS